jgi:hypothetical protein
MKQVINKDVKLITDFIFDPANFDNTINNQVIRFSNDIFICNKEFNYFMYNYCLDNNLPVNIDFDMLRIKINYLSNL